MKQNKKIRNNYLNTYLNLISNISDGEKTLTFVCFFSSLSPENIEQSNFNAKAKYGESFKFSSTASGSLSKNSEEETNVICLVIKDNASSNSLIINPVNNKILSLLFSISSSNKSGAINLNLKLNALS